ncbi:unnamed protein product [Heterobilharzia americana]|nr:unnamed protein product [Heterobilharzia americana]
MKFILGNLSPQIVVARSSNLSCFLPTINRVSLYVQSNAQYSASNRRPMDYHEIERLSNRLPAMMITAIKWWYKIRPLKVEIADLRRRLLRNKEGFETKRHSQTRYFVRFPFLTDEEFANWKVVTDSYYGQGYSWAEFVRSYRSAPGCAKALDLNESVYPNAVEGDASERVSKTPVISSFDDANSDHLFGYTHPVVYPKLSFRPASKQANSDAIVMTSSDPKFKGYGLFRGFISTRVPKRGDLVRAGFANLHSPESRLFGFVLPYGFGAYSHLVIRYRGDGRNYQIVVLPPQHWDFGRYNSHQFTLYTRGGPYWQIAKIPLSKFYRTHSELIHTRQTPSDLLHMRLFAITLKDNIEGPFSLELDYISLYFDEQQNDSFDYEEYCRSGAVC